MFITKQKPRSRKSIESRVSPPKLDIDEAYSAMGLGTKSIRILKRLRNKGFLGDIEAMQAHLAQQPCVTVVVAVSVAKNDTRYFATTLYFAEENQAVLREAALENLIGQSNPAYKEKVAQSWFTAAEMLMLNVRDNASRYASMDISLVEEALLQFSRFVIALLGKGNYVFDTTTPATHAVSHSENQLHEFLTSLDTDDMRFFGVLPVCSKDLTSGSRRS